MKDSKEKEAMLNYSVIFLSGLMVLEAAGFSRMYTPDEFSNILKESLEKCKANNSIILRELEDVRKQLEQEVGKNETKAEKMLKMILEKDVGDKSAETFVIPKDFNLYWALGATLAAFIEVIIIIVLLKLKKSSKNSKKPTVDDEKIFYYEIPDATQNASINNNNFCDIPETETKIRHNLSENVNKPKSVNEQRCPKQKAKNTMSYDESFCADVNHVDYVKMNVKPKSNTWHVPDNNYRLENDGVCPAMVNRFRIQEETSDDED